MMNEDWQWWADRLAGKDNQANPNTPHAGFYREVRNSGYGTKKYATDAAYWPGPDGILYCRFDGKDRSPEYGRDKWIYVCDTPVPEDWYREIENGATEWRDGLGTSPPMGDNNPPDELSFDWLTEMIMPLADVVRTRLDGPPIADQTECDRVQNQADILAAYGKKAEEARKAERKPHDEALKAIQLKWMPLIAEADLYKVLKYKLVTPWLKQTEDTQKKEAEAAALAGEEIPEAPRPGAGTVGRRATLRTTVHAEIVDYEACLHYFRNNPDVKATVQQLANQMIRTGQEVPGAKLIEVRKAV